MVKDVAPAKIGGIVPNVIVGFPVTVTLPVILDEVQPPAFLTVKVKGILEPEAAALKLTVMGLVGKVPSVTAVIPVPEME